MTKHSKPKTLLNFSNHLRLMFYNSSMLIPKSQLSMFFSFHLVTIICNLQHSKFITQGWTFRSSKIQQVWRLLMNIEQIFEIFSFRLPNMHWSTIYVVQNDEWQNHTMWFPWIKYCWDERVWLAKLLCEQDMGLTGELEHERGPRFIGKTWTWTGPRFDRQSLSMNKARVWLTKLQCWDLRIRIWWCSILQGSSFHLEM